MDVMKESDLVKTGQESHTSKTDDEPRKLEQVQVKKYESTVFALFELEAILNVMSYNPCQRLFVTLLETRRRVTAVVKLEVQVAEKPTKVSVSIGFITTKVSCLVVWNSPYNLIISRLSIERRRLSLDFDMKAATFCCSGS